MPAVLLPRPGTSPTLARRCTSPGRGALSSRGSLGACDSARGMPRVSTSPWRGPQSKTGRTPRGTPRRHDVQCEEAMSAREYTDPTSVVLPPLPKFPQPDFEAERARSSSPPRSPPGSANGPLKPTKGTWVDAVAAALSERTYWPASKDDSRPSTTSTSARSRRTPHTPWTPSTISGSSHPSTLGLGLSRDQLTPMQSSAVLSPDQSRMESTTSESSALMAVHAWWMPVEDSVRSRCPMRLEESLKRVHGNLYLKTVRRVRRSASLRPEERHALEMEMAARLVRARALLGKWQVGIQEIRNARKARRAEALAAALEKWGFHEETELAEAKADMERWREMQETLPPVLHEALESRDIPRLRQVVGELNSSGPADIEDLEEGQQLLAKYDSQAKALDEAVAAGSSKSISAALQAWEFDKQDPHAVAARDALSGRQAQKAMLQEVSKSLHGPRLKHAVSTWVFEAQDEDFVKAVEELAKYEKAAGELHKLLQPPANLPGIASAITTWAFSPEDPTLMAARQRLLHYEGQLRSSLQAADGWTLQRLWASGGSGRALAGSSDQTLSMEVASFLQRYSATVLQGIRFRNRSPSELDFDAGHFERQISADEEQWLSEWMYALDDPHVECMRALKRHFVSARARRQKELEAAVEAGDRHTVTRAMQRADEAGVDKKQPQVQAAERTLNARLAAEDAVGALALGVEPAELRLSSGRFQSLDATMSRIQLQVDQLELPWFELVKGYSGDPPRDLHGILEMVMHVLAGVSVHVRDPPLDTEWRSCQRMVNNVPKFLANLTAAPDYVASGHVGGVHRAKEVGRKLEAELGHGWWLGSSNNSLCASPRSMSPDRAASPTRANRAESLRRAMRLSDPGQSPSPQPFAGAEGGLQRPPAIVKQASANLSRPSTQQNPVSRSFTTQVTSNFGGEARAQSPGARKFSLVGHMAVAMRRRGASQSVVSHLYRYLQLMFDYVKLVEESWESAVEVAEGFESEWFSEASLPSDRSSRPASRTGSRPSSKRGSYNGKAPHSVGAFHSTSVSSRLSKAQTSVDSIEWSLSGSPPRRVSTDERAEQKHALETPSNMLLPLTVLRKAKRCIASSHLLAAAWVTAGGDISELSECRQRARVHAFATRAKAHVAEQVLRNLAKSLEVPVLPMCKRRSKDKPVSKGSPALLSPVPVPSPVPPPMPRHSIHSRHTRTPESKPSKGRGAVVPAPVQLLKITVRRLTGDPILATELSSTAFGADLKFKVEAACGMAPSQQRLVNGSTALVDRMTLAQQGVTSGTELVLVKMTLPQLLEAAVASTSACVPADLDAACGPHERPGAEAAAYLVGGAASEGMWSTPKLSGGAQVKERMLEMLRSALQLLNAEVSASSAACTSWQIRSVRAKTKGNILTSSASIRDGASPSAASVRHLDQHIPSLEFCMEPMNMDRMKIRSLQIPQGNLSAARRALKAVGDQVPPVVRDFMTAMEAFYAEFAPQKAEAFIADDAAAEAEHALERVEDVAAFADTLMKVDKPQRCFDVEGVAAASQQAAGQLEAIAKRGLSLPALHVEYVRQAIDHAGMTYLHAPPSVDAGERLKWSEAVVALQLAPLPIFHQCLSSIAKMLQVAEFEELSRLRTPPSVECQRLLAAAIWATNASCKCDSSWVQTREVISESPQAFVRVFVDWDPLTQSSVERLCRARELLLGLWRWVAAGCGGSSSMLTLFAWTSLAVALLPISTAGQRLLPVHQRLRKGLARVDEATPQQARKVKDRAWTAALFLLDSPDEEAWWWLRLIRSATHMTPWTDAEDGGVGEPQLPPEASEAEEIVEEEPDKIIQEGCAPEEQFFYEGTDDELRAAARIQAAHRGRLGRHRAAMHRKFAGTDEEHAAAVQIQKMARGKAARERIRRKREQMRKEEAAALRIQNCVRVRKAKKFYELLKAYKGTEDQHDSATLIQAIWRGKVTRTWFRKMNEEKEEMRQAKAARLARRHSFSVNWSRPANPEDPPEVDPASFHRCKSFA